MIVKKEKALEMLAQIKTILLQCEGVDPTFADLAIENLSKNESEEVNLNYLVVHLITKAVSDTGAKIKTMLARERSNGKIDEREYF